MTESCQLVLWPCHGWVRLFYVTLWDAEGKLDGDMHKGDLFCVLYDSLWTAFHPGKKWIKRSTTFTSTISLFCLCPHIWVICPPLPWFCLVSTFVLFLDWAVFGSSVCFVCFGLFSVTWFSLFGATADFSCLPLPLESAPFLWFQASVYFSVFLQTHLLLWWSQRLRNKISSLFFNTFCIIFFVTVGFVTVQTVGTWETGPSTAGSDSVSNTEPVTGPSTHLKTRYTSYCEELTAALVLDYKHHRSSRNHSSFPIPE